MLTKEKVLTTISRLPDEFSMDELIDQVKVLEKEQDAPVRSENEKVISDKTFHLSTAQWFG